MNANSSAPTRMRSLTRNAVVLASVPVAMVLMTGTASAAGNSGDIHHPQPLSNADQNGTGANPGTTDGCGAYCSTRDGSASQNGRSDNTQSNKPCAGCVGKADNKNPKGQAPSGPVDHNAGYECDRNQGIGQGNPAHTGCTSAAVVTPPVVTPPVVTPPVTPPVVTPPVVVPPVVTPPVVIPPVSGCPVTGGGPVMTNGSCKPVGTPVPPVTSGTTPSTPVCTTQARMATGSGASCTPITTSTQGGGSVTTLPSAGDPGTTTTVSGQGSALPVVIGHGNSAPTLLAGGSATSLPFTGDNTGQLVLFALVLVAAGSGLVIGARRV
ncbi:MAG: Conserved putative secreted protein [Frankiales bacterium]|nr:Conserved putative secreted protein [Frankiales bacterium]